MITPSTFAIGQSLHHRLQSSMSSYIDPNFDGGYRRLTVNLNAPESYGFNAKLRKITQRFGEYHVCLLLNKAHRASTSTIWPRVRARRPSAIFKSFYINPIENRISINLETISKPQSPLTGRSYRRSPSASSQASGPSSGRCSRGTQSLSYRA